MSEEATAAGQQQQDQPQAEPMAQIIITYYPQRGAINIKGHPLLITDKVMALGVLEYAKETIVANINEALAPRIQQATNIPLDLKLASR